MIVHEYHNGLSTHLLKGEQRLKQLINLRNSGRLGFNDLDIIDALISDLVNAINLYK